MTHLCVLGDSEKRWWKRAAEEVAAKKLWKRAVTHLRVLVQSNV